MITKLISRSDVCPMSNLSVESLCRISVESLVSLAPRVSLSLARSLHVLQL